MSPQEIHSLPVAERNSYIQLVSEITPDIRRSLTLCFSVLHWVFLLESTRFYSLLL